MCLSPISLTLDTAIAGTPSKSPQKRTRLIGKDELNLADWRISAPKHQQPRKEDGGKLDVIEHEMPNPNGTTQKVTLMAPSVVGLPTPADEDLLISLLYLAKVQGFASDTVRFSTTQLCEVMHHSVNQAARDRIEQGLTRLKALTIKYELAWWDKLKAEVEPILITGILAEAKFVRCNGRPRKDEPSDSYVQWTNNFYKTISAGNLTDIDLDLYFSFSRPGTKQLYRHLNKRFHRRGVGERYERDLIQLACGHLGMKRSKFVKRNLDQCIRELEEHGYVVREAGEQRYRHVRPGVWRVGFELPSSQERAAWSGGAADARSPTPAVTPEAEIVGRFHALWSGTKRDRPSEKELAIARRLIGEHGQAMVSAALPRAVKVLREKWPDCRTFKGVESYFAEATGPLRDRQRHEQRRRRSSNRRRPRAGAGGSKRSGRQNWSDCGTRSPLTSGRRFGPWPFGGTRRRCFPGGKDWPMRSAWPSSAGARKVTRTERYELPGRLGLHCHERPVQACTGGRRATGEEPPPAPPRHRPSRRFGRRGRGDRRSTRRRAWRSQGTTPLRGAPSRTFGRDRPGSDRLALASS